MNHVASSRPGLLKIIGSIAMALSIAVIPLCSYGQEKTGRVVVAQRVLPSAAEQALSDTNRASLAQLQTLERTWRETFRKARDRDRLEGFVGENLDFFEKLRQVKDLAFTPGATETRVRASFRKRILDEVAICKSLEQSLNEYCRMLDQHDQALLIKLGIDRDVAKTTLSRSVIDPAVFKRRINAVAASSVDAVQRDFGRMVATFIASEVIGAGAKRAAREFGLNTAEPGSLSDLVTGLVIDIGVGIAVDAATDPTEKMVTDLQTNLSTAEREILDGSALTPGFITTLRRITNDRAVARRKLIEAELLK